MVGKGGWRPTLGKVDVLGAIARCQSLFHVFLLYSGPPIWPRHPRKQQWILSWVSCRRYLLLYVNNTKIVFLLSGVYAGIIFIWGDFFFGSDPLKPTYIFCHQNMWSSWVEFQPIELQATNYRTKLIFEGLKCKVLFHLNSTRWIFTFVENGWFPTICLLEGFEFPMGWCWMGMMSHPGQPKAVNEQRLRTRIALNRFLASHHTS